MIARTTRQIKIFFMIFIDDTNSSDVPFINFSYPVECMIEFLLLLAVLLLLM